MSAGHGVGGGDGEVGDMAMVQNLQQQLDLATQVKAFVTQVETFATQVETFVAQLETCVAQVEILVAPVLKSAVAQLITLLAPKQTFFSL